MRAPRLDAPHHTKLQKKVTMHKLSFRAASLATAILWGVSALPAHAGDAPFLGEVMLFAGTFCPRDYALPDGSLQSIAQNSALFAILGTTYGGDGINNFALPNLISRVPIGTGATNGAAAPYSIVSPGATGGQESVTLNSLNLPPHSHTVTATTAPASHAAPATGRVPAQAQNAGMYRDADANDPKVALAATSIAGNGLAFPIRNPYVGMRWCIAVNGIFPSMP